MPSIGGVKKSAVARHGNLRGAAVPNKRIRECRHNLKWRKPARRWIEVIGGNGRGESSHDVGKRALRVEGDMPRTGPVTRTGSARINPRQLAAGGIDPHGEYLVEPFVGHDDEAPGGIKLDL